MKRTSFLSFATVLVLTACLHAQQSFTGPPQAARGFELFTKTAKPQPCSTCHTITGKQTTAGPDLKFWSKLAPRAAAMAIRATLTEKALWVEAKQGEFPGMKISEDSESIQVFDLSKMPPEMRTIAKADVRAAKSNTTWKHPPGTEKYSTAEIADLISYIRWVGAGDKRQISPDEVE
jgi:mono/diheme cytochrome c family protein